MELWKCTQRGHGTCDQSYKINTIIPAITTLYTNMFISLITYLRGLFLSKSILNKIKLLWGHNPLNWLRFQWQLKSVQNCNNVIIVVVVDVVVVVVRDVFDLIVVVIIFQISLTTENFEAKMDFIQKKLAQKRCWYNKMLDQKIKVQKKFWSSPTHT